MAWGAEYYVAQTATGDESGDDGSNKASVATFNAGTGNFANLAGDTVYFSGTITGYVVPPVSGSAGNYITLDGYAAGDCDPLNSECTDSALFDTSDETSYWAINITNKDYIIIQDFRVKDSGSGFLVRGAATGTGESDYIQIKRNFFENIYNTAIDVTRYYTNQNGSNYVTVGGSLADGNLVHNAGYTVNFGARDPWCTELQNSNNAVFSWNKIYCDGTSGTYASNGLEVGTGGNILIEHNEIYGMKYESAMGLKEQGVTHCVIRFNKFHTNENRAYAASGLSIGGNEDSESTTARYIYVYGNNIYGNAYGIKIYRGVHDINIWSNLIYDSLGFGISIFNSGLGGVDGNQYNIHLFNNVVANNGTTAPGDDRRDTGLDISNVITSNGAIVKNSVFYNNRAGTADGRYHQVNVDSNMAERVSLEHNRYFFTGQTDPVSWEHVIKTLAQMQSLGHEDDSPAGTEGDPGFTDGPNDDYTLAEGSACIEKGVNLKDEYSFEPFTITGGDGTAYEINDSIFEEGLDPATTDWSTTPPTVNTVKRAVSGNWDQGAYVYGVVGNSAPVGSIDTPSGDVPVDLDAEQALAGSYYDADGDTCTYAWVIPANTFKDWAIGTTYSAGDLVEDDDDAAVYYKAVQETIGNAPPNATYWAVAETQASPGTGVCDAAGPYVISLTVNDGTDDDPSPAQVTITVTDGSNPVTETWGRNTADDNDFGEDTYFRGDQKTTNQDTNTGLEVRYSTSGGEYVRKAILSFDLSSGSGTVQSASLFGYFTWIHYTPTMELYSCEDEFVTSQANFNVYKTSTNWTGVDHGQDELLASTQIDTGDNSNYVEFSSETLASYISSVWGSGTAYFVMYQSSAVADTLVVTSEDGADTNRPYLEITTLEQAGSEPVVTSITCPGCDGYYKEGDTIGPFYVNFSESVTVTGTPAQMELTLEDVGDGSEVLNYVSGSPGTALNFGSYTVAAGDTTSDLAAVQLDKTAGEDIVATDDAEDVDDTDNVVDTFPTGATAGSLSSAHAIVIDTTAPTVTLVKGYDNPDCTTCTQDGTVSTAGTTVRVYIQASETIGAVYASGGFPRIDMAAHPLDTIYANFESYSDDIMTFAFPTTSGARTTDLDYVATDSFEAGAGVIEDLAGNDMLVFTLSEPGAADSLGTNSAIVLAVPGTWIIGTR